MPVWLNISKQGEAGEAENGFRPLARDLYLSMYWRLEQGPAAAIGLSLVIRYCDR